MRILQSPIWALHFEFMCDASDYVVGPVWGKRVDKKLTVICYLSKTLVEVQMYYDGEGATGNSLCLREVLTIHLGDQDHHVHQLCIVKVLAFQEGGKATTNTMGVVSSRVRLRD